MGAARRQGGRGRALAWSLLGTLACAGALALVSQTPVAWERWAPASCMPASCFCEEFRDGFVRQPANTWSNLGFVLVGCMIASAAVGPSAVAGGRVLLRDNPLVRGLLGGAAIALGCGSWLYHSSMTFVGQWLDVMGMYVIPTFLTLYSFLRAGALSVRAFVVSWVALLTLIGYGLVVVPTLRREGFALAVLTLIVAELWVRRRYAVARAGVYLVAGAATLATAFGIWYLDLSGTLCSPTSPLQGHALWHLLCAASILLVYLYYASEADARS